MTICRRNRRRFPSTKMLKALLKATDQLRKEVEKRKEGVAQIEKQKDDCEHQVAKLVSLYDVKETEVNEASKKASDLTGAKDWETAPLNYAQQLMNAATLYNNTQEEKQRLEKELAQRQSNQENTASTIHGILQYVPEWKSISLENLQSLQLDNLQERATRLQGQVASVVSQLKNSEETLDHNKKLLDEWLSQQHMELSVLKALNAYSQTSIAEKKKELDEIKQSLSQKEAILKEAVNSYNNHLEKNCLEVELPPLDDKKTKLPEETTLSLSSRLKELEIEQRELSTKRGGIMRDLEINQANEQKMGNLKKEEEARKTEYNKWNRLNQLFGDATGNKFRRIAQSYVLASLIHSANTYMRTLSSRYVLKVMPGTFVITMEDAYQGYASRAASTLSGGESFLVSLSLALALSDIGNQLSVDTLFIDEGFGTLSGEPLQNAICTLRGLHSKSGRHVGIISHVEELKERIPVQIRVNQEGNNSSSTIEIVG